MSFEIDNAFVQQFSNNVTHLVQQRGSVLRGAVRTDMQTGKTAFVDQIGGTEPVRRSARHADTPLIATPHSRRRITLVDYEWADLIDEQDKVRLLAEMEGPYATNAAWAMGRAMDDEIIAAALGTSYTGEEGTTTVALPASQKVLADSAGLTLPKLREARRGVDSLFHLLRRTPEFAGGLEILARQMPDLIEKGIRLDDEGKMHIDPEARPLRVATRWKSLEAFHEFLAERLLA